MPTWAGVTQRMTTRRRRGILRFMGCDIHMYVEKRDANGTWQAVPPPERDLAKYPIVESEYGWGPGQCMRSYGCDGTLAESRCRGHGCPVCRGTGRHMHWYWTRAYNLFGVLAGVRRDFTPIAPPRGMPSDVSECVREHHTWDHTPSWFTVAELLAFDWTTVGMPLMVYRHDMALPALGEEWPRERRTYGEMCADFLEFVREMLVPLGPAGGVRIVFGFDS